MAFSKKRARSLDSNEAEEAHPKKEIDLNKEPEDEDEADLNEQAEEAHPKKEIDLNKEPEAEDGDEADLNKEAEVDEDAIQHEGYDRDEEREEEDEKDQDDVDYQAKEEIDLDRIFASVVRRKRTERYEIKEEPKDQDEDDSEQTLSLLSRWEMPATPPDKIIYGGLVEQCSRPIRKQLTESDVSVEEERSSRLTLAKSQATKKFLPLLEKSKIRSGKDGIKVSVYGPDGNVHEMKMWFGEHSFGLTTGWRKFVGDYELREFCDIVTVWMFRHYTTQKICLAIDSKRFVFRKQLSKRIAMAAFED